LATVVPGRSVLLLYLWGGFSLGSATLGRFLSLHFLLPLIVMALLLIHLVLLHMYNSSNMFGLSGGVFQLSFIWKDVITIVLILLTCSLLVA
jgi:quinol-cytochrome oxidoreductase complex cytochrome b subunit